LLAKPRSFDGRPPLCPPPPGAPGDEKQRRHRVKVRRRRRFGLYAQYFSVGVIYGGLPSTMFGVFLGWMNVPGYVYATASTLIAWPWSLKFLFGAVNDCMPIWGYRRKPYMMLGWLICAMALFALASTPLPEPFWCDDGTKYVTKSNDGTAATPCNPESPNSAGTLTFLMTLASFGYCASDCAADGLTVTLARREPPETRGRTQTTVYLVRTLGNVAAVLVVGLGMNSWHYNGTFERGLSFNQVAAIFAAVALAMVPISWFFVYEPRLDDNVNGGVVLREDDDDCENAALDENALDDDDGALLEKNKDGALVEHGDDDDDHINLKSSSSSSSSRGGGGQPVVGALVTPPPSAAVIEIKPYSSSSSSSSSSSGGGKTKTTTVGKQQQQQEPTTTKKKKKKKEKNLAVAILERRRAAVPPVTPNLSVRIVRRVSFAEYRASVWSLLRSRAMLTVVLYQLFTPLVGGIFTTAAGEVKQHWAQVKVLQNATFSLAGLLLFSYGLHLVKRKFLNVSWRAMTAVTTIFLNVLDMPFTYLTVFDVVRNQYFFLGEILVAEIPAAANFVISTFVVVEMSESGSEGLVYGLLTTTSNLGAPVAQAISDQLFSFFQPSLSDPRNYQSDTSAFRTTVAASFTLSYFFAFASLAFLPLLPDQKEDAQRRKKFAPAKDAYAYVSVALVVVGLVYSFLINALAVWPRTSCLRAVGGPGCSKLSSFVQETLSS